MDKGKGKYWKKFKQLKHTKSFAILTLYIARSMDSENWESRKKTMDFWSCPKIAKDIFDIYFSLLKIFVYDSVRQLANIDWYDYLQGVLKKTSKFLLTWL